MKRSYEQTRNALREIRNETSGSTLLSGYTYTVNDLGQRSAVAQAGSAFGVISGDSADSFGWAYDSKGQVVSAASANGSTDDRYYAYDGIGNRTQSRIGTTTASGGTATDYYGDSAATTPGANPLNQYVKVITGSSTSTPTYDDDGNMTSDGASWNFAWDGENRLISATPAVPTSGLRRMTYRYDWLGRLTTRLFASYNPAMSNWTDFEAYRYVYDGWNRIEALNWDTGIQSQHVWGLDLSGSMQGAGGVGGMLLWANSLSYGSTWTNYHPTYDGNGNVSDLIDGSGAVAEHWEYDAFGNTTQSTNSLAWNDPGNLFEFRFSTKPQDAQTGLYYYGYRFYDPVSGRWPSRDPIGEKGGLNIYAMLANRLVAHVDALGLEPAVMEHTVGDCEIYIYFGHTLDGTDTTWHNPAPGGCWKAGVVGCNPGRANEDIPDENTLENNPTHHSNMIWNDDEKNKALNLDGETKTGTDGELHHKQAVKNILDQTNKNNMIKDLCDCRCLAVTLRIRVQKNSDFQGIVDWMDANGYGGIKKEFKDEDHPDFQQTYDCKNFK